MGDGIHSIQHECAMNGTTCSAADLRGVKSFLTHGGLLMAEGGNQYDGQSVVLRQFVPHHKQTAKNGVSLAVICRPETQNGTLAHAINRAHGVYIRRTASPHRSLQAVSLFPESDSWSLQSITTKQYAALNQHPCRKLGKCATG